jgi:hypothetical protein
MTPREPIRDAAPSHGARAMTILDPRTGRPVTIDLRPRP